MAMAIVEELWARIRAAIDDKIVAAEAAAESAEADRVVVEQAAMSASWSGDRLTVLGATSPPLMGPQGPEGPKGDSGDGAGDVLWSELDPVLDGKAAVSHDHTASQISDATSTGRAVLTAADAAAARGVIGAGTSNLTLGTTSSTAKAGNYQPTAANITDATTVGRNVLKASDAAAARTAIGAGTSNLALGTTSTTAAAGNHTHTSANITDARTWTGRSTDSNAVVMTDPDGWFYVGSSPTHGFHPANKAYVDGRTPEIRVVSTIPTSPTPGVVYLRFG